MAEKPLKPSKAKRPSEPRNKRPYFDLARKPLQLNEQGTLDLSAIVLPVLRADSAASTVYLSRVIAGLADELKAARNGLVQLKEAGKRQHAEVLDSFHRNFGQLRNQCDALAQANLVRRTLAQLLSPLGVTEEQEETSPSDEYYRVEYRIGDLHFVHTITPRQSTVMVDSVRRENVARIKPQRLPLGVNGRLTVQAVMTVDSFAQALTREAYNHKKLTLSPGIFSDLYEPHQPWDAEPATTTGSGIDELFGENQTDVVESNDSPFSGFTHRRDTSPPDPSTGQFAVLNGPVDTQENPLTPLFLYFQGEQAEQEGDHSS